MDILVVADSGDVLFGVFLPEVGRADGTRVASNYDYRRGVSASTRTLAI